MKTALILSFALLCALVTQSEAAERRQRLLTIQEKLGKIFYDSSRSTESPKDSAESEARQLFLHSVVTTKLHESYLLTLILLWEDAETAGEKERIRGSLAAWAPLIRESVMAGQDFIRAASNGKFSDSFRERLRETLAVYQEFASFLDEDLTKIVEKKPNQ